MKKKTMSPPKAEGEPAHAELATTMEWLENRRVDKMAERLSRQIVDDVTYRKLQPGAMLPSEAEMIKEYKVGRATLREALRLLEVQGFVVVKPGPGGGPVVAKITAADFARVAKLHLRLRKSTFREILQARLAIEPLMARLAAEAQSKEGLAALRNAIELADKIDMNDMDQWMHASALFHSTIASISGNTVLDLLGMFLKEIYHSRRMTAITPVNMRSATREVHREIADAIFAADAARAEHLMHDHMVVYAKRTKKIHDASLDDTIPWK